MASYNLHKINKLKREDGIMSFELFWKKYKEAIDYSLMSPQQIENILWTDIFIDEKWNMYVSRMVFK